MHGQLVAVSTRFEAGLIPPAVFFVIDQEAHGPILSATDED
jgi:hypothetical protein